MEGWFCGDFFKPSKKEWVPQRVKDDRNKYFKDLIQPWRDNQPSREFIDAYPEKSKTMFTEKEKKDKILNLLQIEISRNRSLLAYWLKGTKQGKPVSIASELFLWVNSSDEIWNAFSDGGELQWIRDPLLLSAIADAYGDIRRMRHIAD